MLVINVGCRKDNNLLNLVKLQHTLLKPQNHRNKFFPIKLNTSSAQSNVFYGLINKAIQYKIVSTYVTSYIHVITCLQENMVQRVDWESTDCGYCCILYGTLFHNVFRII